MDTKYGDISPATSTYCVSRMLKNKKLAQAMMLDSFAQVMQAKVQPIDVPCRYCKAEPGEGCTKWRRAHRNGKGRRKVPRHPHPDRVYDAKCADDAVKALSFDEPSTVMWRP